MDEQPTNLLIELPNELHLQYASYLDARTLSRLSRTCQELKNKFSEELERAHEAHKWALATVNYGGGEWESQTAADVEARVRRYYLGASIAVASHPERWSRSSRIRNVIEQGRVGLLEKYLKARGDPNLRLRPEIASPLLHLALYSGAGGAEATIVRLLLEYGAEPNLDNFQFRVLNEDDEYPQPGDEERIKLVLSHGGRATDEWTIFSLYQLDGGSALVRMAVANGTNLMELGWEWYDLVGTLLWDEARNRYTDDQVFELLDLEPQLITVVEKSAKYSIPYIRQHRPALAERLIREPSPVYRLANLCEDLYHYL
ncbi:uncharacterized protein BO95DRAFT_433917 [Aspergillus brunneoviolaceus CBS 621.78]|uniref:Uncharacterized protein n=1 Tax=Aspergillus brunneoviolaceus CBS 621.78 TaxID=1450534 RepID=A0ACD1G2K3_9EURO|nr:hypothetical protein BO95DRAFT_433917 [Aspergillus brunneoviolaceus CBS 621.78]RAH43470.1 hypothetical protein BO95DRAFT_433917 [Aspergillus brunneoviolaceus CBS 621.78]